MANELTADDVFMYVEEVLREDIGEDITLSPETNLQDDLDIDSLEVAELSIKLEKKFDIKLTNAEMRQCTTIADIVQLVVKTAQSSISK